VLKAYNYKEALDQADDTVEIKGSLSCQPLHPCLGDEGESPSEEEGEEDDDEDGSEEATPSEPSDSEERPKRALRGRGGTARGVPGAALATGRGRRAAAGPVLSSRGRGHGISERATMSVELNVWHTRRR